MLDHVVLGRESFKILERCDKAIVERVAAQGCRVRSATNIASVAALPRADYLDKRPVRARWTSRFE